MKPRWRLIVALFRGGTPYEDARAIADAVDELTKTRAQMVTTILLIASWGLTACCLIEMYYQRRENREWKALFDKEIK